MSTSQQDNILVESTLSVPAPPDVAEAERNPLILNSSNSSVKVVKSYNVQRNTNVPWNAAYVNFQTIGWDYNNWDGPNFEMSNTKISTLIEINAQELQNIGSTQSGGVNGLYDVNINVAIEGGGNEDGIGGGKP